ncbi:MAG TPA: hypothetical protein VJ023_13440 [Pyrinomonadaceae bacterium]|nr:hypothetical protein [Pyrinomonadaceae bacterium]
MKLLLGECVTRHLKRDLANGVLPKAYSAHMSRGFRTAAEFQELGKYFELFPGEFLDGAAQRRISWFGG